MQWKRNPKTKPSVCVFIAWIAWREFSIWFSAFSHFYFETISGGEVRREKKRETHAKAYHHNFAPSHFIHTKHENEYWPNWALKYKNTFILLLRLVLVASSSNKTIINLFFDFINFALRQLVIVARRARPGNAIENNILFDHTHF